MRDSKSELRVLWTFFRVAMVGVLTLLALKNMIIGNLDGATLDCVIILMLSQGFKEAS